MEKIKLIENKNILEDLKRNLPGIKHPMAKQVLNEVNEQLKLVNTLISMMIPECNIKGGGKAKPKAKPKAKKLTLKK